MSEDALRMYTAMAEEASVKSGERMEHIHQQEIRFGDPVMLARAGRPPGAG